MAESGCKCKSLSIHRPDTSGYLMYHTSNLCIIHQILCIGTISSDTSCIIHQIFDVYLHLHPDERLAPNFAIHGAIHILYSDTAYTAIHGDTAYRMYHPPSGWSRLRRVACFPTRGVWPTRWHHPTRSCITRRSGHVLPVRRRMLLFFCLTPFAIYLSCWDYGHSDALLVITASAACAAASGVCTIVRNGFVGENMPRSVRWRERGYVNGNL